MDFAGKTPMEIVATIATHLSQHDIEVVLVGGMAVEFYSESAYLTKDIDFVDVSWTKPKVLNAAMAELGYVRENRYFRNPTTDYLVEFPSAPLTAGDDMIHEYNEVETPSGSLSVVYVDDIIKDRLTAYTSWNDKQSLLQAVVMMQRHECNRHVHFAYVEEKAERADHYPLFKALYEELETRDSYTLEEANDILYEILLQPHRDD